MHKKILLIFVMIMALLLIGISCSNNTTASNNGTGSGSGTGTGTDISTSTSSNPINNIETMDKLRSAIITGLGGSLQIKNNGATIKLSDTNTILVAFGNSLQLLIIDLTINTPQAGSSPDTIANLNNVFNNLKTEMAKVGVNITEEKFTHGQYDPDDNSMGFSVDFSANADAQLPEVISNSGWFMIRIQIGLNGTWTGDAGIEEKP